MALDTGRHSAKYALSIAAMLAAAGMALPAAAADLGGNCCADLEERVAELEATTARKGNRKVSLTVSGQVSTAVMAWSDGNNTRGDDVYIVDNVPSGGTFFAFTGSAAINPNVSAGFNVTIALDTGGRSHQVTQLDDDGTAGQAGARGEGGFDTDIVMTLANWYIDHKQLGRVTVGRINTATAGISTIDLGGAGVTANSQIGYTARSMFLANNDVLLDNVAGATWANILGGNTVNGAGLSRANAISYITPTFGGFSASAAWGEDDVWDVALRYAGEFSGFRVAAGIGYIHNSTGLGDVSEEFITTTGFADGAKPTQVKGSASVLHVATGLYLTGAYVNQDNDTAGLKDTTLWYVQGGIAKNWTGLGNTVFYGEYARVEDAPLFVNSEANVWGLGVVQHIDAAAMELFLSYRNFSAEAAGFANINDLDVVMGGARIRF